MLGLETYYFTEKEGKEILKNLVYLIDTREQENEHIISCLEKKNAKYKSRKLNSGDYSVMIPKMPEFGIARDVYLDNFVVVERKNSLDELSGNLAQNRQRFENELFRTKAKVHLVVEDGGWEKIFNHSYNSEMTEKSYYRSLLCLQARYGNHIHFIQRKYVGFHIMNLLECAVKELLNI